MKINKVNWILCALLSICCATSAMAVMPIPFGWYAEGNAGQSKINQSYSGSVKNTGFGWNVDGGYKFNAFLAAEIGYTHYSTVTIKDAFGTKVASDSHYSYDVAGKVILPAGTSGLEIFGKIGLARMNSNLTVNDYPAAALEGMTFNAGTSRHSGLYAAVGADYAITPVILVNIQAARAKGNSQTGNGDLYSLGLSYIV